MAVEKKVYSVTEISEMMGISKPTAYDLVNREDFPSIRVGEKRIVTPCGAFDDWLAEQVEKKKLSFGDEM